MKKRTWMAVLTLSVILCLVLAYMAVRSWKEYRMAKENLEMIERITEEMKAREVLWKTEMEDWIDECEKALMDGDVMSVGGLAPYGALPGLTGVRMSR